MSDRNAEEDNRLLLIVRCIGLGVSSKTSFKNVGLWNSLYLKATGKNSSKNEKRVIRISQSEPYKPAGRPSNFNFSLVYVSEIMDDQCDATPSMIATVCCPPHLDCKLRVNVYYYSALTGGKEVLLAGTTFSKRELVRAAAPEEKCSVSVDASEGTKGVNSPNSYRNKERVLISEMNSKYCASAKAYVEIVKPLPDILRTKRQPFAVAAAPYSSISESTSSGSTGDAAVRNPLEQHYAFYNEVDNLSPLVEAKEITWEPRFAGLVPLLFLDNFTAALMRSINAWNVRAEMERKRQGRFRNLEEAHSCGWHSVIITVRAARIGESQAQNDRIEQQLAKEHQNHSNARLASYSGGSRTTSTNSHRSTALSGISISGAGAASGNSQSGALYSIMVPLHPSEGEQTIGKKTMDSIDGIILAADLMGGGLPRRGSVTRGLDPFRRRVDETAPSTFVEISLEHRQRIFQQPIGRTSTEYHSYDPMYGSNINAHYARKGSDDGRTADDTVDLVTSTREYPYVCYEVADRDLFARAKLDRRKFLNNMKESRQQHQRAGVSSGTRAQTGKRSSTHGFLSYGKPSPFESESAEHFDGEEEQNSNPSLRSKSISVVPHKDGASGSTLLPSAALAFDEFINPHAYDNAVATACNATISYTTALVKEMHFCKYVSPSGDVVDGGLRSELSDDAVEQPEFDGMSVRFDVCIEETNSNQRRLGTCTLPLEAGMKTERWLPVQVVETRCGRVAQKFGDTNGMVPTSDAASSASDSVLFDDMELLVKVSVKSPPNPINDKAARSCTGSAPPHMAQSFLYHRCAKGVPLNKEDTVQSVVRINNDTDSNVVPSLPLGDYREAITDGYEWMWQLGFNGHDPLALTRYLPGAAQPGAAAAAARSNLYTKSVTDAAPPKEVITGQTSLHRPDTESHSEYRHTSKLMAALDDEEDVHAVDDSSLSIKFGSDEKDTNWEHFFTEELRHSVFDCSPDAMVLLHEDDQLPAVEDNIGGVSNRYGTYNERMQAAMASDSDDEYEDTTCGGVANKVVSLSSEVYADANHNSYDGSDSNSIRVVSSNVFGSPSSSSSYAKEMERSVHEQRRQPLIYPRVDFPYPLAWMRKYITEMEQLAMELRSLRSDLLEKHRDQRTFRPSTAKKDLALQALPLNLHYQLMAVRQHTNQRDATVEVIHCLTCGAMTAHALGHKKGGLFFQEGKLVARRNELEWLKQCFGKHVVAGGGTRIPRMAPFAAFPALEHLGLQTLKYEENCLQVARRRVYTVAQALSIAVNAFLLKLSLAAEGFVEESTCAAWLETGFLIVFEGLLSVASSERSMLEDTMSAVEGLRNYQILIRPALISTTASATCGSAVEKDHDAHCDESDAYFDSQSESDDIRIQIVGRQVMIAVDSKCIAQFPHKLRSVVEAGEGIVHFVPVLFTQGIDIQQTLMTTFGGDSKGNVSSVDLQQRINLKAFNALNEYCHHSQPISHSSHTSQQRSIHQYMHLAEVSKSKPFRRYGSIHPLVQVLHSVILSASPTLKNVDLLMEVERVTMLLSGCRVVFCKSGKDRTGMAVTLAQSRELGEQYGCGVTIERILRDANLMRLNGTRIMICEKNIGKRVYSFNMLQAQFLPAVFRPPAQVCEELMRKDNS